MRPLNLMVLSLGVICLVVLAIVSLGSAIYPGLILTIGDFMAGPLAYALEGIMGRAIALLFSLAITVFLIYLLWGNVQASRRERTVVLQNPMGEVLVSLPAIEDFARVLKGRIDGLRDIRGRVTYNRRGLKVSARVSIYSDCNIAEVANNIQEGIREYMQKTLNIEQEINPAVVVTKVVSRERATGPTGIKTSSGTKGGATEIPLTKF